MMFTVYCHAYYYHYLLLSVIIVNVIILTIYNYIDTHYIYIYIKYRYIYTIYIYILHFKSSIQIPYEPMKQFLWGDLSGDSGSVPLWARWSRTSAEGLAAVLGRPHHQPTSGRDGSQSWEDRGSDVRLLQFRLQHDDRPAIWEFWDHTVKIRERIVVRSEFRLAQMW